MNIIFHLKAENSSGQQNLRIDPDKPKDEPNKVAITLVGEYEGEEIQIDFKPIDKDILKSNLKQVITALED